MVEKKLTFEMIREAMRRVAERDEAKVRAAIESGEYVPPAPYIPIRNSTSPEALQSYRDNYPKECAKCGGSLEGPDRTDEELIEQIEEHDRLFPGQFLSTAEVICDPCFQGICPGGNLISMD